MYKLVSYTPDEEIIIEKNPNYYGTPTNVDKYIIKLEDDSNTQMMGLSNGDLDIVLNLNDDTMEELASNADVTTENSASKTISFIMMNEDESIGGPVSNPKVQEAIKYALDYPGLQNVCGSGSLTPKSLIQVGFLGSAGELDISQDLDKAKSLMEEAGYPDGFTIDMPVCELDMEGIPLLDVAQKVKEDLSKINITANIVQQNWGGGYGDDYRDGKLGLTVMYWGIDYYDPNVQLAFLPGEPVGLRASWKPEGNEALLVLNEKILAANDNDERSTLLLELQEKLNDSCPFIMLAQAASHIGYSNRLSGVYFTDTYRVDVTEINVK